MGLKIETWEGLLESMEALSHVDLYYEAHGSGKDVLLLIHGFGQNLYTWRHIVPSLSEKYRLILVDLKGFGKSPKPKDGCYTIYDQVKLVLALIIKRNLSNIALIGHSYGGAVSLITALYLTLYDKRRLSRLVLIDNPAFEQKLPPFVNLLRIPLLSEMGSVIIPAHIQIKSGLRYSYLNESVITDDAVDAYAASLSAPGGRYALIHTARQMVPSDLAGLSRKYADIDIPVLLIWGAEDAVIPLNTGLKLENLLSNGQMRILPGCGHVPQEEKPGETLRYIKDFLQI